MLINLSHVLTSEGALEAKQADLEMDAFKSRLGSFPISKKTQIQFQFTNIGRDKVKIEGECELEFEVPCARCLTICKVPIPFSFQRIAASPEVGESEEIDDLSFMEGYQLNVEAFMQNEILENWPLKILCRDDCKGVCPKCGKNLNEGDCGCDTFVPDPRMAVLKDIFKRNKEV